MSRKRTTYTAEFKAKVVLEVLEGEMTLNQIASKYELLPANVKNWKKIFLDNMSLAFDKSTVVKEYKEQIETLEKSNDNLAKKVGNLTVEKDFLVEKLQSLVLKDIPYLFRSKTRKTFTDTEHKLSLNKQCKLLHIAKSTLYYTPVKKFTSEWEIKLLNELNEIHSEFPYYGTRRLVTALGNEGFRVGRKLLKSAMEYMGIRALYPKHKTTQAYKEHYKYKYLLKEFKNDNNQVVIDSANKVWSADITYIKLEKGFAYLAAIIDWHTKKILSWKLSNSMDVYLTTSVLNEALSKYPKPEIFNTDQGSQYTAKEHIDILIANNILISMDAKGRSIDNIVMERFWRSIKYEDIYPSSYKTIKEARDGIKEYIEIYNKERLHSSIDYLTPDEVYYKGVNNKCYNAKDVLRKVA